MVPIGLYDTLIACANPDGELQPRTVVGRPLATDDGYASARCLPSARTWRIAPCELLRQRAGVEQGISLELVKRIPSAAGLGGGSSDAAAALLAANAALEPGLDACRPWPNWRPNWAATCRSSSPAARPFAADAANGSSRSAAWCRLHFVVVRPPVGLSTAEVYGHCRSGRPAAPRGAVGRGAARRRHAEPEKSCLQPAGRGSRRRCRPWVERLRRELARQDCLADQMSGSGTSYFGICHHARHARRVARRLQARGLGQVYAVSTSN